MTAIDAIRLTWFHVYVLAPLLGALTPLFLLWLFIWRPEDKRSAASFDAMLRLHDAMNAAHFGTPIDKSGAWWDGYRDPPA